MHVQTPPLESLAAVVETLKQAWRAGAVPDAVGALREYPDLLRHRSLVVDLAYEEFCLREEAGQPPETEEFCHRFPAYGSHVREVIRGHRLLADHPELLDATPAWPRPGEPFEQLTVIRELGRGAFARVYLARDPETGGRLVALKLAPARSGEARTLGPIAHPHIVSVLWARPAGGFFAVCMPFVGAVTLRDAIESAFRSAAGSPSAHGLLAPTAAPEPTPTAVPALLTGRESHPDAVAAITGRLAGAVEHLHRAGIGHGDLKPSNVLLGPGGHPYLIDFNLSTALPDCPLRCGGTLPYMAPERLRLLVGGTPEPGPATAADVYSFGVVLFEALTGRVPLEPAGTTDPGTAAADLLHRHTALRSPTAGRAGIPGRLAGLIDRCLDPNPGKRPAIGQVKRELDRYLSRHARRRFSLIAAGLLAAIAAGWLAAPSVRPVPERSDKAPVAAPVDAQPATADEFFARGMRNLKAGYVASAMKDFDDANRLRPDGPSTAYLAHCQSLSGQDRAAADLYRKAIRDHGFGPAWVHNNRANSLLQAAPTPDKIREAAAEAEAALALAPALRPARLNRAYARFRLSLAGPTAAVPDPGALADIEAVMSEPPYTADLYAKAAVMTAAFGEGRPEHKTQAVAYLEGAVRLGHPPKAFESDPLLRRHLAGRPDFQRILELPAGTPAVAPPNPHLVTPPLD